MTLITASPRVIFRKPKLEMAGNAERRLLAEKLAIHAFGQMILLGCT